MADTLHYQSVPVNGHFTGDLYAGGYGPRYGDDYTIQGSDSSYDVYGDNAGMIGGYNAAAPQDAAGSAPAAPMVGGSGYSSAVESTSSSGDDTWMYLLLLAGAVVLVFLLNR